MNVWDSHCRGSGDWFGIGGVDAQIEASANDTHIYLTIKKVREASKKLKVFAYRITPVLNSITLTECDPKEAEYARTPDDPYGRSVVGKALRALGATVEEPVSTDVLASVMVKAMTGDYTKNREKATRKLDGLSTTNKLKAYVIGGKWGMSTGPDLTEEKPSLLAAEALRKAANLESLSNGVGKLRSALIR